MHTTIAIKHGGPVAVPDIPSYLHHARSVTGVGEDLDTQFHPGLGLLLTPVVLLGVSGGGLHTAGLLLNALVAAIAIPLTCRLAASLGASRPVSALAALVCAVFPVFTAGPRTAWPEPLLALAVLIMTVRLVAGTKRGVWTAGVVAALSVAVHPRAVVLCAVLLGLLALRNYRRSTGSLLLGLAAGAVITTVSLVVTSTWLWPRVSASLNTTTLDQRLFVTVGQLAAVMGVSCGFAWFAAVAAWRNRNDTTGAAHAVMFNVFGVLVMAVLGGWVLGGGDRPDLVMYSRYVSPFALPLTIIGLCFVAQHITRRVRWLAPLVAWVICTIGSGWLVEQSERTYRRIMTLSNGWAWAFGSGQARTALLLTVGLGALSATLLMNHPRSLFAVTTLLIGVCSVTTVLNHQKLAEIGEISQRQTQLHSAIPHTATCVSFDRNSTKGYLEGLYRLERPELLFTTIDLATGDQPCADLVIAGRTALTNCQEAQLQVLDDETDWALWHYPPQGCG